MERPCQRVCPRFHLIFFKYKTTDITALAIYTGASRPKIYDRFHVAHHGTEMTYKFNAYTVREQKEAELLTSDNPFAFAALASLYLIKAGNDAEKKLEFKKKLAEIAYEKNYDFGKLQRMLNFVKYLVKLPPPLEFVYQGFSNDSKKIKNIEKMELTRDFLDTHKPLFGKVMNEIREEGIEKGRQEERKKTVLMLYKQLGLTVEQIVNTTTYPIKFVKKTIADYKKTLLKKE